MVTKAYMFVYTLHVYQPAMWSTIHIRLCVMIIQNKTKSLEAKATDLLQPEAKWKKLRTETLIIYNIPATPISKSWYHQADGCTAEWSLTIDTH